MVARVQAGVWALGPHAVCSHSTAASLHRFDGFDEPDLIEFTVPRHERNRRLSGVRATVHSTDALKPTDRHTVDGLPVTAPGRTILDLANSGCPDALLEAAIDSAIRLRMTTVDHMLGRVRVARDERRRGVRRLADLLVSSGGESFLERRLLKLLKTGHLPMPTVQSVQRRSGRHIARVDFVFEWFGVVVEVSGGRGHSTPADRAKDARRRNQLQQMGLIVLEFTFGMVMIEPEKVVATIRESLSRSGFGTDRSS